MESKDNKENIPPPILDFRAMSFDPDPFEYEGVHFQIPLAPRWEPSMNFKRVRGDMDKEEGQTFKRAKQE